MNSNTIKYYKLVRTSDYQEDEVSSYIKVEWDKVPQDILNLRGSLFTIYDVKTLMATPVILLKKCRSRKTAKEYNIGEDIIVYL